MLARCLAMITRGWRHAAPRYVPAALMTTVVNNANSCKPNSGRVHVETAPVCAFRMKSGLLTDRRLPPFYILLLLYERFSLRPK